MTEFASELRSSRGRDAYGIAALIVAIILLFAFADWPYEYYQFLRIVTCLFSASLAYRAYRVGNKGWIWFPLFGAILFNPFIPFEKEKGDWSLYDFVFAVGYGSYGLSLLSRRASKAAAVASWIVLAAAGGGLYYVNSQLPHGPTYPSGDIVCINDDRGPCGEAYKEDMRGLNIPAWAKSLRANSELLLAGLFLVCSCISGQAWFESEGQEELLRSNLDQGLLTEFAPATGPPSAAPIPSSPAEGSPTDIESRHLHLILRCTRRQWH